MNNKNRSIIYIESYVFMIVINTLSILLPFGGQTVAQVSQNYESLFTPSPYAFSIWGLIYLLLLGFIIFQAQPKNQDSEALAQIGWLFPLSCLLNSLWLIAWQNEWLPLSVYIIISLLITLIMIYTRLQSITLSPKETLFVRLPFSIYTAWVSVAVVANISAYLAAVGFDGFGLSDTYWACIMIVAVTFLGIAILYQYQDIAFVLVLVWALIAVANRQADSSAIVITTWMSVIAIVIIALLVNIFMGKKSNN